VYLKAEERLFQAVAPHDFNQVFEHTVKHLVKLFPNNRQWLLGWQYGCIELHL